MWLILQNLYTRAAQVTPDERSWLRSRLSYRRPTAGGGSEVVPLYDDFGDTFATGFVGSLLPQARKAWDVEVIDKRRRPCDPDPSADLSWLRDYQLAGVHEATRRQRGIYDAATSSGKTEIMVGITQYLPCRWLMVVNSMDLVKNCARRYEKRTGEPAGMIGDGTWLPSTAPAGLTCATFQTLARTIHTERTRSFLAEVEGLLVDESHTLPAASFWDVAMSTPRAYWRFGFSGTPLARGDKRNLLSIGALGRVVYRIGVDELYEKGVIAKPRVRMVPVYQTTAKKQWHAVYKDAITRSQARNDAVVDVVRRAALPAFVFVTQEAHGKALRKALAKAVPWGQVEFVWGKKTSAQRDEAIARLQRGDTSVIVCSTVFQTGIDVPELRSLVVASGGKSVIQAIQRIGRGMRRDVGKRTFDVWDFEDKGIKVLDNHARERRKAYTRAGYETVIEDDLQRAESAERAAKVADQLERRRQRKAEKSDRDDLSESPV